MELKGKSAVVTGADAIKLIGEMDTLMHKRALPNADPAALASPEQVAARIIDLLESPEPPSGARVEAQAWRAP
jgi:hypothetical protein